MGPLQAQPAASESTTPQKLIDKFCVECHDQEKWRGGLALDLMDPQDVSQDAAVWEKVVRKLRTGMMPPAGEKRPDKAAYHVFTSALETELDTLAAAHPNPGRPSSYHRLNRAEYTNAIRDLLAIDVEGESLLPADEGAGGFDNSGEILSVSAMLMERYLIAAHQISRIAVGDLTLQPMATTFDAPEMGLQTDRQSEDLPFGSRGGMAVNYNFALDGEYSVKIRLQRTKGIEGPRIMGLGDPHQLDVRVDGKRVKVLTIGGDKDRTPEEVEKGLEVRFPARAGNRLVGVTFLNEDLAPEGMQRPQEAGPQLKGWGPKDDSRRPPGVESVSIGGPYNATPTMISPSRARIFVCHPTDARSEEPCARRILAKLARQAYRRSVTDADVEGLIKYYATARQTGSATFDEGIRAALEALLVSPDFLFRIELDPPNVTQGMYPVSDVELASRLSFFLWSSIPDEQLLDLAARGRLKDPAVLQQQVRRMLADPRSRSLVNNFFGQWLGLRSVKTQLLDPTLFPEFDDDLRNAFQQEADLLFTSMLHEDRSVLELLTANYTYVNERLARHYGIPGISGSRFRRVTLRDENRWGILGKGALLMITSLPNRSSPVLRGKWVLENVIGSPPPHQPPNVPPFPEDKNGGLPTTVRARLEQHRKDPKCASCHAQMDPLGFALENFDPAGEWRTAEAAPILLSPELPVVFNPIDSAGVFPGGGPLKSPAELRRIVMEKPEDFMDVATEKLVTYALGRELDYYDEPAIRKIIRDAAPGGYRWSAIISGIVNSLPFQMRAVAVPENKPRATPEPKTAANTR
jgi:hypothetical protein